jgi:hypothetical protein
MGPLNAVSTGGALISVAAAGAAIGFGSVSIGDLNRAVLHSTAQVTTPPLVIPSLLIQARPFIIQSVKSNLVFTRQDTNAIATWSGNYGIGSVPNADTTLTGTDVDVFPSTAIGPAVAGKFAAPEALLVTPATKNPWGITDELNLNLIINAADIVDSTTAVIKVQGYVDLTIQWL